MTSSRAGGVDVRSSARPEGVAWVAGEAVGEFAWDFVVLCGALSTRLAAQLIEHAHRSSGC